MIGFEGVRVSREEAQRIIATLRTAAGVVPVPAGEVTHAHVMAVALYGLAAQLRRQLGDEPSLTLAFDLKPLRAMVTACHEGEPSMDEIEERLALALEALRPRPPKPH